ncbi:MAG TPA: NAD(P)H-dependent oxidoreductase [Kofleriaceae bacterium]|nr:NAD(P)H-dependent oxidoreductase [Kofleriaceae bacterium]
MIDVGIVIGSTRPGRKAEAVAKWVHEHAQTRTDAKFELVDIADYNLPLLDEPVPPSMGKYSKEHTKKWAAKIGSLDAFVFVTPEYNHGTSGALKNALDFLFAEWADKAAGFVAYGGVNGARAVEHLRAYLSELQVAHVRAQVGFNLRDDFENYTTFKPSGPHHEKALSTMLDQLVRWATAFKTMRKG